MSLEYDLRIKQYNYFLRKERREMIKFEFLPAGSGDCIFVNVDDKKHILIDGGYVHTYHRTLKKKLKELEQESKFLDLVVVTHIDNDHINGIKKLFGTKYKNIVKKVWFNSGMILRDYYDSELSVKTIEIEEIQEDSEEIGYTEGIQLESLLNEQNISNRAPIQAMDSIYLHEFNFKILSPDNDKLSDLSERWNEEIEELSVDDSIEISGDGGNDYDKTIEELVSNTFNSDGSITNGSSIAFIMKYKNFRFLFLADAFVEVVVNSLISFKYSKEKPLKVEFVKLSHHGSKKNINESLLELIDTDTYIILTDGNHDHPNQEALSRIIMFNKDKSIQTKFYFNHEKDEYFPDIFQQHDLEISSDEVYDIYLNQEYNFILYFPKEDITYLEF